MTELDDELERKERWYFRGDTWGMKTLRFLNLLEENDVRLSLTNLALWASTINSIAMLQITHDLGVTITSGAVTVAALAKHEFSKLRPSTGVQK